MKRDLAMFLKVSSVSTVLIVGTALLGGCPYRISPEEDTRSAFREIAQRYLLARRSGIAPTRPEDLPKRAGYSNATSDHWGNPITMRVEQLDHGKCRLILRSRGEDQVMGTTDDLLFDESFSP